MANGEKGTDAASPQKVCAGCGFVNPAQFRYCGGCGAALESRSPRAVTDTPTPWPHPERRQLTVLFCDLVGSSALSTRLDPEELRDLILSYQEASTSEIRRFGGTISRYVGDGIRALFGYPQAHEDDAERAVRAGLDVVRAVAAIALPGSTERLAVHIGIATGLVVVGDVIGQGVAEEEAVLGETPNLAARVQALGVPNSVVISAGTRALLGERFECLDLGDHVLHGFPAPVPVWQVVAARPAASRFEAAQAMQVTLLVNRVEYLQWLVQLWQGMGPNRGQAVLISGEAGIGKSRVVSALRERIAESPHWLLSFQCSPHYSNTALYPVIEHIERAAGIGREDEPSIKVGKLARWPGAAPRGGDEVALFGALLSIPPDPRYPMPALSPQRQKERTFGLLLDFMRDLSNARPLLIVFEDLHWVDPTTQEFLALLIDRARDMRAFVVLTSRTDYSPSFGEPPFVQQRELLGLEPAYVMGLAEQVAGERHLPMAIIEQVVAKTDGVPLFVEELTRAVLGTGLLNRDRFTLDDVAVPSTLQDSLMARLDQLGPAKLIAQVAGAIGREFSYELLKLVVPLPNDRLREGLDALEHAGLAYAEQGTPRYVFKHALVQEVAYQSLLRSHRRELHRTIAQALESHFPQTARDAPELVAHHWTEAGDTPRAIAGWLAAGRRASGRAEYNEAIAHLRNGIDLISPPSAGRPPLGRAMLEQNLNLHFELRNALLALGRTEQLLKCLEGIEPLLDVLGEPLLRARYAAFRCNYHFLVGEQHEAIRFGNEGLRVAMECGNRPVSGELLYRVGQSYHALGQYREAIDLLGQSLAYTADERDQDRFDLIVIPSVVSRAWLVTALVEHGDFADGIRFAGEALRIAETAGHEPSQALALLASGQLFLRKGDFRQAVADLERGLELCDRWSLRVWRPRLASTLGVAYGRVGRAAEGLKLARQALADAEQMQIKVDRPALLVRLGQASLINGQAPEAIALGNEALETARAREAKGDQAWARFLVARAYWASAPQNLDELVVQFETALDLAQTCEAQPLAAFCRTMLGAVHGRRGDRKAAERYSAEAETGYRDLGMRPLPLDPVG